ncbi:MAG: hypothetical protein DWQ08_04215, partial [Proteobacteria bacterium]
RKAERKPALAGQAQPFPQQTGKYLTETATSPTSGDASTRSLSIALATCPCSSFFATTAFISTIWSVRLDLQGCGAGDPAAKDVACIRRRLRVLKYQAIMFNML